MSDTPLTRQLGAISVDDLVPFSPNRDQTRAKARVQQWLRDNTGVVDLESLTLGELTKIARDKRLGDWLRTPGFGAWLSDKESFAITALAMKDSALDVIRDVLESDYEPRILTAKDKLKAADMLLTLTGSYPTKVKEIRYLDRDLDNMSDDEVQRQIAEAQKTLAKLPSG